MARKKKNLPPKKKKEKPPLVTEWSGHGWSARVVDNEDGGGWALEMTRDGDDVPAMVVPWIMGRNKKDPKPLNEHDFTTQVKAANDLLIRREKQRRAAFRKSIPVYTEADERVRVVFDIDTDDFEPVGILTAEDDLGQELARYVVPPRWTLTRRFAQQWVAAGMPAPELDG